MIMRRILPVFISSVILLFSHIGEALSDECFSAGDLMRLRTASNPSISPGGRWIAYEVTEPPDTSRGEDLEQSDIWIADFEGGRAPRPFAFGPSLEHSPRFSPDGVWVGFISDRGGTMQVYRIRVDGGEAERITDFGESVSSFSWSPDGARLAVIVADPIPEAVRERRERGSDEREIDGEDRFGRLWIVDASTGEGEAVSPENLHIESAAWSPDGSGIALITASRPTNNETYFNARLELLELGEGRRTELSDKAAGPVSWNEEGSSIAFIYRVEHADVTVGVPTVAIIDVSTGDRRILGRNHAGTLQFPRWIRGGERLVVVEIAGVRKRLAYLSVENDEVDDFEEILGPYYGGIPFDVSPDGSKVAMLKGTTDTPPELWAKELGFLGKTRRLTRLNPWLEGRSLPKPSAVKWTSRDGTEIEGVLVLPPGYSKGTRYPAVLSIHGGPMWAWWLGWHGTWHEWAMELACRGFVVLLPNPRGSVGYGVGFARANFDDWGGGDFEDVIAGADFLVENGYADGSRMGICGWSYGGYMSAWAITQTDRFSAAVVGAGVTNLYSFHGTTDITPTFLEKYFRETAYRRPQAYRDHSSMSFVRNAGTPTLILHGEEDSRVPAGQAYELYRGLVQSGVEVELVVYPREGHGFREILHQIDLVDRIAEWFERHL